MTSNLYNQIMNDRGSFERMIARLPGFEGYLDQKARRTADRILRDHIADALRDRINRLARIETRLLDKGGITYMSRTSSVKSRLQTYHDRVRAAAPGYSGFFEAVKIRPDDLQHLYGFDELQMVYVDKLTAALDTLEEAVAGDGLEGVDAAIVELDALAVEANEAYSRREDALVNLGL